MKLSILRPNCQLFTNPCDTVVILRIRLHSHFMMFKISAINQRSLWLTFSSAIPDKEREVQLER